MAIRRDGQDPSGYIGLNPSVNPPNIIAERAPTSNDRRYKLGTEWINKSTNAVYKLTSVVAGSANWEILGAPGGAVATITGDSGGALSPSSGNINVIGTSAQGLSFAGSGSTLTGTIADAATGQKGVIETATNGEVGDQTSATVAVTPANLASLRQQTNITFQASPLLQTSGTTGGVPTGATGDTNLMILETGEIMEQFILGAGQTIIAPRMSSSGLSVELDQTDNEGAEYNWGGNNVLAKHTYVIGTDPAFYLEWRFTLSDVTGCDPVYIGFRKQQANQATYTNYTDFAFIGVEEAQNSALVTIATNLNSAGASYTNTTDGWADGETHTLRVNVSAAGVVTFLIDGVAPTSTAAFTFDTGDVILPCFHGLHGTTAPGTWHWVYVKAGLQ